ncbi:hypothetical protein VSS74_24245 [Conexibacter stalactiti]|uniref:MucB/RseB N-terminal domain-containing protein n=1 Tax=Conexibacter stalactiti TaxID=1940611 RepID=A0ABU4HVX9_9ACTN|nr:hypothetical protein [Conexibacter stalactiti]MDW5597482.1 hypothetical protein [Conexibacter stalactiti]MEC5038124.1 hypothetical protein [Conexibacter stalactiti]
MPASRRCTAPITAPCAATRCAGSTRRPSTTSSTRPSSSPARGRPPRTPAPRRTRLRSLRPALALAVGAAAALTLLVAGLPGGGGQGLPGAVAAFAAQLRADDGVLHVVLGPVRLQPEPGTSPEPPLWSEGLLVDALAAVRERRLRVVGETTLRGRPVWLVTTDSPLRLRYWIDRDNGALLRITNRIRHSRGLTTREILAVRDDRELLRHSRVRTTVQEVERWEPLPR